LLQACPACSLKKFDAIEQLDGVCENCSILITAYNRYYHAGIPLEFWQPSMDQFEGPEILKKIYANYVENLNACYNEGKSFLISGTHGLGKSMVSCNILKKALQKNFNGLYITMSDMVSVMIEAPFAEKFGVKKELLTTDFLVLDEVDPRFIAGNGMELFGRTLEHIIRSRFSNRLPNIFITNSPNMLETFTGEIGDSLKSLFSRVKEFSVMGKDFRKGIR
jgi:DNA replication protein DnaC